MSDYDVQPAYILTDRVTNVPVGFYGKNGKEYLIDFISNAPGYDLATESPSQVRVCGYLVDKFSDATSFSVAGGSVAGTHTTLVGGGRNGENVTRITLNANGGYALNKTFNTPLPIAKFTTRKGFFVQAVRVNDVALIPQLQQFLFLSIGGQYYQRFPTLNLTAATSQVQANEWFYIDWIGSGMNAAGGAAAFDSNVSECVSLRIGPTGGFTGGVIDLGELWYGVKQNKPVITFGFDDSNKTDITVGKPILDRYNFKAVTYTIREQIGAGGFLTVSDLRSLHNAGWEIGVHGSYSHYDTLRTQTAIYDDVSYNMGIFQILNIPRSYSYAYPEGEIVPASIPALRSLGFTYAGSVHSTPSAIPFMDPLMGRRSATSGKTLAALKLEVDTIIAVGGHLEFFSHQLLNVGGIHTDPVIFEGLVEYVAEKQELGLCEAGDTPSKYF